MRCPGDIFTTSTVSFEHEAATVWTLSSLWMSELSLQTRLCLLLYPAYAERHYHSRGAWFLATKCTFTLLVAVSFVHQRPRITSVGKVCLHPSVLAGNSCLWSLNPGMPCLLCGLFENSPAGFQHHERQNNIFTNHRAPRRLSTPPLGLIWRFYWILLKLPWASLRVIGEPLTPTVCLAPPLQVFSPGPSKVEI